MIRELSETIYRITVEDITLAAKSHDRDEDDLTPEVMERVIHKIEDMDDGYMADLIDMFIDGAIDEIEEEKEDYAEHIVKDRINIIDWINLDAGRLYDISKVMDDIKAEIGRED